MTGASPSYKSTSGLLVCTKHIPAYSFACVATAASMTWTLPTVEAACTSQQNAMSSKASCAALPSQLRDVQQQQQQRGKSPVFEEIAGTFCATSRARDTLSAITWVSSSAPMRSSGPFFYSKASFLSPNLLQHLRRTN